MDPPLDLEEGNREFGPNPPPLENHKSLYVSLNVLVRPPPPLEKAKLDRHIVGFQWILVVLFLLRNSFSLMWRDFMMSLSDNIQTDVNGRFTLS